MAPNQANFVLGAGNVSVAAWQTAGGATVFTDVGATFDSFSLKREEKWFDYDAQQYPGICDSEPISAEETIEFSMGETDLAKMRWAMNIAAAQLTGTPPNETLYVGGPVRQFWTVKVTAPGPRGTGGTRGVQTITLYKVRLSFDGLEFDRNKPTQPKVKGVLLYDTTLVTNSDQFHKHVIAGAA